MLMLFLITSPASGNNFKQILRVAHMRLLFIVYCLLFIAMRANATSCSVKNNFSEEISDRFAQSKAILVGKVKAIIVERDGNEIFYLVDLYIIEKLKGDIERSVTVMAFPGDPELIIDKSKTYLMYLNRDPQGQYYFSQCSRVEEINSVEAQDQIRLLRLLKNPKPSRSDQGGRDLETQIFNGGW